MIDRELYPELYLAPSLVQCQKLKSVNISGKFLIPKICLVDFLVSLYSFDITQKIWKHLILIKVFLEMH